MAHRVGSLRRTESVAIEGIADIRRSLAARRSDANDPSRHLARISCCSSEAAFSPYQSTRLSRYDAVS
jgi:hypothetical protein